MTVTKRTRDYTYHTRGKEIVARKRGGKKSPVEQEMIKQKKDIKDGLKQLLP